MPRSLSLTHRVLWKALTLLDRPYRNRDYECRYRPLFIIGPPRSGTTLAKQLITWSIPSSFFTNLTQLTAKYAVDVLPAASAMLVKYAGLDGYRETFTSAHGYSPGLGRPAGASTAWWRLMGVRYDPIEPKHLSERQRYATKQAVAVTEHIFGKPFVNKTSAHSVCVRALAQVFDGAIFVRVVRDPLDVAQSIYRTRTNSNNARRWIGGRPPEAESFSKFSIAEQSGAQVYYLEKYITRTLDELEPERVLTISYPNLCRTPETELERICSFMRKNGNPAEPSRSVPSSFPCVQGRSVEDRTYRRIEGVMRDLRP